jgi:hypothetical protein
MIWTSITIQKDLQLDLCKGAYFGCQKCALCSPQIGFHNLGSVDTIDSILREWKRKRIDFRWMEVVRVISVWWNLFEWWRRSNKFGNLMLKKNLMFFSTVITSKPEIARDTPIFWLYHFVFLDAFHHITAVTWDQVFWHWIHLHRRRIKVWEL